MSRAGIRPSLPRKATLSHRLAQMAAPLAACFMVATPLVASDSGPRLVEAAKREGTVVVYSVLSASAAEPLIRDFEAAYPGIKVSYDGESGSYEVDARFRREFAEGSAGPDVVWSSAMDMQLQLVRDGYAARYAAPELRYYPRKTHYNRQAFSTTIEPVVFVHNKLLLPDVPTSHAELRSMLLAQPERFRGKITGFDPRKSGVGRMFTLQDSAANPDHGTLLSAFCQVQFAPSGGTGDMLVGINSGQYLFGYNMMGAHALRRSSMDLGNLAIVYPRDYMLALSRVAIISRKAPHPNAARLWVNYLLSERGQKIIGNHTTMHAIRDGIEATLTAQHLRQETGSSLRIIALDMSLVKALNIAGRGSSAQGSCN